MACVTITVHHDQEYEQMQLPIIDFSSLRTHNKPLYETTYHELRNACQDWGCFVVVNHGIDYNISHNLETVTRAIFRISDERKQTNKLTNLLEPGPFIQSIGIPGAPDPNVIQKFVDQIWPQGNPEMCKIIETYARNINELTNDIIKAIVTSLGMSKYCDEFEHNWGALRLNRCGLEGIFYPHKDGSCITVINQDKVDGLQVLSKGGKWVNVKPVDNSFVVFMGDALTAWSNGWIQNVTHRVIMGKHHSVPRFNMPFFSLFSNEKVISAAPEFVDDRHPRLYRPFAYGEYLEYLSVRRTIAMQREGNSRMDKDEGFLESFAGILVEPKE